MVELLVASTLSAIMLSGLFASLGTVYFSQKKINATQHFASESRFLMERVSQLIRNNTLDYDRFFVEVGPSPADCVNFEEEQIPFELRDSESDPIDLLSYANNPANREAIGYMNLFYWNVATGAIERYRNLGGKKLAASPGKDVIDPCAQAWHGALGALYLINQEHTERTAIQFDSGNNRLQTQRLLGVDTTGNGKADRWGFSTEWNSATSVCTVYETSNNLILIGAALGVLEEKPCARGHTWTNISPEAIDVLSFEFIPGPNRDPYLNYRIDSVQTQPHVFLRLHTKLRRPGDFGMKSDEVVELIQQTTASSRVFGDPR